MKFKILLIPVFIIFNLFVNGQSKLQGYILDKQTSKPILYATIGAVKFQYGTYSDTSGLFTLYYKSERDSLKISYLGYKSIYTCVKDLQQNSRILLEPNPVQLNEVVINPKKTKKKSMDLGYFSKKYNGFLLPPNSLTHATFIPFPKDGNYVILKSIRFKYRLEENNTPLRIHILNVVNNGVPGDDMLIDNIIFDTYERHGKQIANIDISKYNLIMPHNGVFITLELIDCDKSNLTDDIQRKGPAIGVIPNGGPSSSKWYNDYNFPKWYEMTSFRFTFAIGLSVVNYTE